VTRPRLRQDAFRDRPSSLSAFAADSLKLYVDPGDVEIPWDRAVVAGAAADRQLLAVDVERNDPALVVGVAIDQEANPAAGALSSSLCSDSDLAPRSSALTHRDQATHTSRGSAQALLAAAR
jgi:hypothetical protein